MLVVVTNFKIVMKDYHHLISKWVFLPSKQWLIFQISSILCLPYVLGNIIIIFFFFWPPSTDFTPLLIHEKHTLVSMVSTQVQCSHCLQLKILSYHVIYSLFFFQLLISYNLLILSIPFFSVWKLSSSALFTWKYVKYDKVKGKVNVYYHTNYTSWSYKLCVLSSLCYCR